MKAIDSRQRTVPVTCATPDEAINKFTTPKLIGSWMWRTERSYVTGSMQTAARGDTTTITVISHALAGGSRCRLRMLAMLGEVW